MAVKISPSRVITTIEDQYSVVRPLAAPPRIPPIGVRLPAPAGLSPAARNDPDYRGITPGSLVGNYGTRGNYAATTTAVHSVQYPDNNSSYTRSYYIIELFEPDVSNTVRRVGGDNTFLFAGQKGMWEDKNDINESGHYLQPTLRRSNSFDHSYQNYLERMDDSSLLLPGQQAVWRGDETVDNGWQCIGNNCQTWLESAYLTLRYNSDDPVLHMLGILLDEVGRDNDTPTAFHFNLPEGSGAITYSGQLVGLDSGYLSSHTPSEEQIGILLHELWHTQQPANDRLTVWGEIDAYNLETVANRAFGLSIAPWRTSLEQYGTPGVLTRDLCSMCQARECLLQGTDNHWFYSAEPVVNSPWLFPWLTVMYFPTDCAEFCPDVRPLDCP